MFALREARWEPGIFRTRCRFGQVTRTSQQANGGASAVLTSAGWLSSLASVQFPAVAEKPLARVKSSGQFSFFIKALGRGESKCAVDQHRPQCFSVELAAGQGGDLVSSSRSPSASEPCRWTTDFAHAQPGKACRSSLSLQRRQRTPLRLARGHRSRRQCTARHQRIPR